MMNVTCSVILVFCLLFSSKASAQDDFDRIIASIQKSAWESGTASSTDNIKSHLFSIQRNGSWSDIDYSCNAKTQWIPANHLHRLKEMVLAYTKPQSSYNSDKRLYNNIVKAYEYWYMMNPTSSNWYNQQIRCPKLIGETLILMQAGKKQIPTELENKLIARMESIGGRPDQSGSLGSAANKINIATHWVYRACLTKSDSILAFAMEQILLPVKLTIDEGLQHDFSYFQHGQQLYTGGYGFVLIANIAPIAIHTANTKYAPTAKQIQLISNFALNSYLKVIRGKYMHYNLFGRGISKENGGYKSIITPFEQMQILDPANKEKYEVAIQRLKGNKPASYGITPKFKHFWRADYSLYISPEYAFDVRMVSSRTERNENGNGENMKGYFLADGATDIAVDGDEYLNIFPTWDWSMIPGTTTPHLAIKDIPVPKEWGTLGTSNFVGGVSDGLAGISVYDYNDTDSMVQTKARKSWFFLADKVLCLGSSVNSSSTEQVNTTLNQCLLKDEVIVSTDGSKQTLLSGIHEYPNNLDWVYHNKVAYFFPKGGNVSLSNREQTGTWHSINTRASKNQVKKDVFTLAINHGTKPIDYSYVYMVMPGVASISDVESYKMNDFEIISCTDSMHIVKDVRSEKWFFAFFRGAKFSNCDFSISSEEPCVFILDSVYSEEVKVTVASPSKLDKIVLDAKLPAFTIAKRLICELPSDTAYSGSSREFIFNSYTMNFDNKSVKP